MIVIFKLIFIVLLCLLFIASAFVDIYECYRACNHLPIKVFKYTDDDKLKYYITINPVLQVLYTWCDLLSIIYTLIGQITNNWLIVISGWVIFGLIQYFDNTVVKTTR